MKRVGNGGVWLPDDETDPLMISGGIQYQSGKFSEVMKYVKNDRVAVDVGAHCGLWTCQLSKFFQKVECFEPLPRHIECWNKNVGWRSNCSLHQVALGSQTGECGISVVDGLSGRSHVSEGTDMKMLCLDDFNFKNVDLIKIDVEGYEYFVIKGGEKTILESKPAMIVEQKKGFGGRYGVSDKSAVDHLESLGAVVRKELAGDYILSWQ